jgi:hypothetical protein
LRGDAHFLRVSLCLGDLGRAQFRFALPGKRVLLFRFRFCDQGRIGSARLLEFALFVGNHPLGFQLRFLGPTRLLGGDDFRVRLRFGRRNAPARFRYFGLNDFNIERIENETEIGQFARARFAYDDGERIVVIFRCLNRLRRGGNDGGSVFDSSVVGAR